MTADDALTARLREIAAQVDPPPETLREAARWALSWRDPDAELAELTDDSTDADKELAGVRSVAAPRMVTFETGTLAVEVEVVESRDRRELVGQLVPPQAARVEVRHRDGTVETDADDLGRFAAEVPAGPVSLRCRLADGRTLATDWLAL